MKLAPAEPGNAPTIAARVPSPLALADRSPGPRGRRHTASDDKGAIVRLSHTWVLPPVDAATATLAGVNRLQRVNLAIGALGLVLLVASAVERNWLMVLLVLAQAIAFLGQKGAPGANEEASRTSGPGEAGCALRLSLSPDL